MDSVLRCHRRGITYVELDKICDWPVCFSASDGKTHLIDINGNQIYEWEYLGLPGDIIDPELVNNEKGHLFVQYEMLAGSKVGIFGNKTVAEINQYGDVVWKWGDQAPGGAARQNHDWKRLSNGNTMMMVCKPRIIPLLGDKEIGDQGIYEVNRDGEIVWSWMAGDYIEQLGFSDEALSYMRNIIKNNAQDPWGYLEMNTMQVLGPNKWYDSGNEVFHPENIVISSRKASFVAIIEKKTGNIVWKIGPYSYKDTFNNPDLRLFNRNIPRPIDQTSGQHNAHMIPKGLPGEGNILLLDNQGGSGYPPVALGSHAGSRILEINPVTKEIVWEYTAEDSGDPVWTFYTSFVGSVQRLPNGNTLINEGMNGRIFQITNSGEIVWEYINPYLGKIESGKNIVDDPLVYRVQAVPHEWIPDL